MRWEKLLEIMINSDASKGSACEGDLGQAMQQASLYEFQRRPGAISINIILFFIITIIIIIIFITIHHNQELGTVALNVSEGRDNLWTKTRQAFHFVYHHHKV